MEKEPLHKMALASIMDFAHFLAKESFTRKTNREGEHLQDQDYKTQEQIDSDIIKNQCVIKETYEGDIQCSKFVFSKGLDEKYTDVITCSVFHSSKGPNPFFIYLKSELRMNVQTLVDRYNNNLDKYKNIAHVRFDNEEEYELDLHPAYYFGMN